MRPLLEETMSAKKTSPARRPWYLSVVWHGDGPVSIGEYFQNHVDTHMGDDWPNPPPTNEEMQHVMHAAKMEMARQFQKRRKSKSR